MDAAISVQQAALGVHGPDEVVHGVELVRRWRHHQVGSLGHDGQVVVGDQGGHLDDDVAPTSSPVISRSIHTSTSVTLPVGGPVQDDGPSDRRRSGRGGVGRAGSVRAGGAEESPGGSGITRPASSGETTDADRATAAGPGAAAGAGGRLDPDLPAARLRPPGRCRCRSGGPHRVTLAAGGGRALVPTGVALAIPRGLRRLRPAQERPGPEARGDLSEHAGAHRLGLPGRAGRPAGQHRPRGPLRGAPGRPDRPAGHPAGRAGGASSRWSELDDSDRGLGGFGSTGR